MDSADFTGSDRKHQAARRFVSPPKKRNWTCKDTHTRNLSEDLKTKLEPAISKLCRNSDAKNGWEQTLPRICNV